MKIDLNVSGVDELETLTAKANKLIEELTEVTKQIRQITISVEASEPERSDETYSKCEPTAGALNFIMAFSEKARLAAALSGAKNMDELCSMSAADLLAKYGIGQKAVSALQYDLIGMGRKLRETE